VRGVENVRAIKRLSANKEALLIQDFVAPLQGARTSFRRDPGATRYALAPGYFISPLRGSLSNPLHD
jgi:hypothetical protein